MSSQFDPTEHEPDEGHACLLYADSNDQKRYILPFIQEGLLRGEHCLFICSEDAVDDWSWEFQAYGIDVLASRESGALTLATAEEWRRNSFKALAKARELWGHIEASLAVFPAVRIAGEASWSSIEPPLTPGQLAHWEATADLLYEGQPVKCICMYDLRFHAPSEIQAALRTHPHVVFEQQTHANPFYERDEVLEHEPESNGRDADAAAIEAMLARVRSN